MRTLIRWFVRLVVVLVIALALFYWLGLEPMALKLANRQLNAAVTTSAKLEGVSISLLRGEIGINGLTIANPEGMSEPNFLELGQARVFFSLGSLIKEPYTVQRIEVQDVLVSVVLPEEGEPNVQGIFVPQPSAETPQADGEEPQADGEEPQTDETESGEPAETEPAAPGPSILLKQLSASNLKIVYVDESVADGPARIQVVDGNVEVRDIAVSPSGEGPDSDTRITFHLADSPYPNEFYARAWAKPVQGPQTDYWGGLHFSGVDLDLLKAYVTPMARNVIGSQVIDVSLDVAQTDGLMLGTVTVTPLDKPNVTLRFSKQGDEFKVDKNSLLLQAFSMPFARILNLGKVIPTSVDEILGSATEVAGWAADTVMGTAGELAGATGEVATAAKDAVGGIAQAATRGDVAGAAKEVGGLAGNVLGAGAGAVGGILGGLTGRSKEAEPAASETDAETEQPAAGIEEGGGIAETVEVEPTADALKAEEVSVILRETHRVAVLKILEKRTELAKEGGDTEKLELLEQEAAESDASPDA
jgi:hypothetical protein